jgi:hypothetical protein
MSARSRPPADFLRRLFTVQSARALPDLPEHSGITFLAQRFCDPPAIRKDIRQVISQTSERL